MVKTLPFNAGDERVIPRQGVRIAHTSLPKNQNIEQEQYYNKSNKDFKNGLQKKIKKTFFEHSKAINIHVQVVCMYFVFDIYLGVLLGHITPCLNFEELLSGFSKWLHHFTFLPAVHSLAVIVGAKWCLTVVLTCRSLMSS